MKNPAYAQDGLLTDATSHVEFLTFVLRSHLPDAKIIADSLSKISVVSKSISQKDDSCHFTITVGFSANAWNKIFADKTYPVDLAPFKEMKDGDRSFPSTPGDIFFMIKSTRMDLNYQAAKYLKKFFEPVAKLTDDVQGYKYLDDRDMIDFVDGTENPKAQARIDAVLSDEPPYYGGSYLTVQKYIGHFEVWDTLKTEEQEGVIGRTKMDDIEIDDDKKKPYAHNVKSKVFKDGVEIKMLRQNRAFGNAMEHGTMFIGFAATPDVVETSLNQMITADSDGNYDKLLDFVRAVSGSNYFIPPKDFVDQFGN